MNHGVSALPTILFIIPELYQWNYRLVLFWSEVYGQLFGVWFRYFVLNELKFAKNKEVHWEKWEYFSGYVRVSSIALSF